MNSIIKKSLQCQNQIFSRQFSTSKNQMLAKMTLIGTLARDPEQRTTRNGSDFVSYTIVTNDLGPSDESGRRQDLASFHRIFAFGEGPVSKLMELKKGSRVYIEADFRLEKNDAITKDDGSTQYGGDRIIATHRTLQVLNKPKSAEDV